MSHCGGFQNLVTPLGANTPQQISVCMHTVQPQQLAIEQSKKTMAKTPTILELESHSAGTVPEDDICLSAAPKF